MTSLIQYLNFARMSMSERRRAEIDLVAMGIEGYKALSNTLYSSQILHHKDIQMIKVSENQGDLHLNFCEFRMKKK